VGASVEVSVVDPARSPSVGVQESGVLGHSVSTHDVDVALRKCYKAENCKII
jgi:hypothetical protein